MRIAACTALVIVVAMFFIPNAFAGIAWVGADGWLKYTPDDGVTIRDVALVGAVSRLTYNPYDECVYYTNPTPNPRTVFRVNLRAPRPAVEISVQLPASVVPGLWSLDPKNQRLYSINDPTPSTQDYVWNVRSFDLESSQAVGTYPATPPSVNRGFGISDIAFDSKSQSICIGLYTTAIINGLKDQSNAAMVENLPDGAYICTVDTESNVAELANQEPGGRWLRSFEAYFLVDPQHSVVYVFRGDSLERIVPPMRLVEVAAGGLPFCATGSLQSAGKVALESVTRRLIAERLDEASFTFTAWLASGLEGSLTQTQFLNNALAITFAEPDLGIVDAITTFDQRSAVFGLSDSDGHPTGEQLQFSHRVEALWAGGESRKGLAADGVSSLILRTPILDRPGFITWTLEDISDGEENPTTGADNGVIWNPFSPPSGPYLPLVQTPTLVLSNTDLYRGVAVLTAPLNFLRTGHEDSDSTRGDQSPRKLRVQWRFDSADGTKATPFVSHELELHRPPVVLLHGLFDTSDSFTWDLGDRFAVASWDYRGTNGAPFLQNIVQPKSAIEFACWKMRQRGIAATQADVFGHSMGGVLARLYAMNTIPTMAGQPEFDTDYFRRENLGRGDMHKLVTVNTPHFGSEMAAIMVSANNETLSPFAYWIEYIARLIRADHWIDVCDWLRESTLPDDVTAGAVRDLRPDSIMIARMNAGTSNVPTHAMIGTPDVNSSTHCYAARTRRLLAFACEGVSPSGFFAGANDGVVRGSSQAGGLDSRFFTLIPGDAGLHWPIIGEPGTNAVAVTKAIELLNAPLGAGSNPKFNVRLSTPFVPHLPPSCPLPTTTLYELAVCRSTGVTVELCLDLIASAAAEVSSVVFVSSAGEVVEDLSPPFEAVMGIPPQWVGTLSFGGLAYGPNGQVYGTTMASVWVDPPTGLQEIRFDRDEISLTSSVPQGESWIRGLYADGIERNLSVPEVTIAYAIADGSIASVDAEGRVTARRVGQTILTASYGGFTASVPVRVLSAKGDWDRNGAVDLFDAKAFDSLFSGPRFDVGFVEPDIEARETFDFDGDRDVDCDDWLVMREMLTGPPYVFPISERCEPGTPLEMESVAPEYTCQNSYVAMYDMSSDGRVACGYRNCGQQFVGVLWSQQGDIQEVPSMVILYDLSANGEFAVGLVAPGSGSVGILSTSSGLVQNIGSPAGTTFDARTLAISDDGQRVVARAFSGSLVQWTLGSGWSVFPQYPAGWASDTLFGMSSDGEVIAGIFRTVAGVRGVFRWSAATGFVELPLPASFSVLDEYGALKTSLSVDGLAVTVQAADAPGSLRRAVLQHTADQGWRVLTQIEGPTAGLQMVSPSGAMVLAKDLLIRASSLEAAALKDHLWYSGGVAVPYGNWEVRGITDDAGVILGNWGISPFVGALRLSAPPPPCAADVNGDRLVDGRDLSVLLSNYGESVTPGTAADFNGDGVVDGRDLSVLLARFGRPC